MSARPMTDGEAAVYTERKGEVGIVKLAREVAAAPSQYRPWVVRWVITDLLAMIEQPDPSDVGPELAP